MSSIHYIKGPLIYPNSWNLLEKWTYFSSEYQYEIEGEMTYSKLSSNKKTEVIFLKKHQETTMFFGKL